MTDGRQIVDSSKDWSDIGLLGSDWGAVSLPIKESFWGGKVHNMN